jgi:hypothetical protein
MGRSLNTPYRRYDVPVDSDALQRGWDQEQETYLSDREERFAAMLDAVERAVGCQPLVPDLARYPIDHADWVECGLVWHAGADAIVVGVRP